MVGAGSAATCDTSDTSDTNDLCRFSKGHGLRIGAGKWLLGYYCAVPVLVREQVNNPEFL